MYSSSGDIEVGVTLRKARQDVGVTLDDVEYETKIRKRYLEALEREDYEDLPSAVYARGFLKTYANYLGLDGEELSQELKNRWEAVQERQRPEAAPKESRPGSRWSRDTSGSISTRHTSRRISPLAILGLVLALVLIAAAFSGLYWLGQNSRATQGASDGQANQPGQSSGDDGWPSGFGGTSERGQSTNPSANGEAASGPSTERTASAEATPSPPEVIRVTVTVEQVSAWLNVQTDGDVVFEQVAQPGFSQTFEAGRQVAVWTGNAGAVRLEINGQDYGALGAPGEVKRQIFTLKPAQD